MRNRYAIFLVCALLFLAGCSVQASDPTKGTTPTIPVTQPEETLAQTLPTETLVQTLPPQTEATEPAVTVDPDRLWLPICQEFINLRESPGGEPIATIPVNETVILEKWAGKYALVTYGDTQGYVLSNYIKPADGAYLSRRLQVVTPTETYTYDQMLADISSLQQLYPDTVRVASIGMSEQGRKIPVMQLGNPEAEYHVLMQGAMHAREHFTAWLLMALSDFSLSRGYTENVCYHIIPMSNPDGVCISQSETLDSFQTQIYQNDLAAGYTTSDAAYYAQQWKANALGIDLNRNFSSGWEVSLEHADPSSEKYRGDAPFSAAESRALRDYTVQQDFDATISVHSHGSVIYYQYGEHQPVNDLSYSLALAAKAATGYEPISYDGTTGAGYKDWAMDALGIPSLTLEIGCYNTPLAKRDIYNTFARCEGLFPAINAWLAESAN